MGSQDDRDSVRQSQGEGRAIPNRTKITDDDNG